MRKHREQIVQSRVSSDVIFYPKRIKFFEVGKSGAGFRLSNNRFPPSRNAKLKTSFDFDVMMTSTIPYDPHSSEMINYVKFDVCLPVVSEESKCTHTQNKLLFIK